MSLCYSVRRLIGYILAENCIIWYTGRARMQKVPKFLLKSMYIYDYFNKGLESTLYKLQNAHKNRISRNRWKYEMTGTYKLRVYSNFLGGKMEIFVIIFFGGRGIDFIWAILIWSVKNSNSKWHGFKNIYYRKTNVVQNLIITWLNLFFKSFGPRNRFFVKR